MKLATGTLTGVMLGALILFSACASITPPQPPSLELPKPPADLHALRKGNRVTLTWTVPTSTTDRQTIRHYGPTRICRTMETQFWQCGTPVGEISTPAAASQASTTNSAKRKVAASYVDTLPLDLQSANRTAQLTYAVETENAAGRSAGLSNRVIVPAVGTLPAPEISAAQATRDGVRISWMPPVSGPQQPEVSYRLHVYRRRDGDAKVAALAEIKYLPAPPDPQGSFVDQSFEWEQTYFYHLAVVTVITEPGKPEVTVEGDDSPDVKVFAHDVFPPSTPANLQAAFSGPGQRPFVDLIWAPVTDVDLDGYNVYRHEAGEAAKKINDQAVRTPAYRDENVLTGKKYFYSISAVDVRGNESARSDEASENIP